MKKFIKKTVLSLFILLSVDFFSQAPESINYQGVARDASGNVVTTAIGVKFEIKQGSATGPVIYDETHTIIPASSGVFTAAIGRGISGTGTFSTSIVWGSNKYFLTVNIDPAGGTSYSSVGTSELLSVPYALYAKTSGNASTTYSAGNAIAISSGSIINTAPNQTVYISGGGGTTVSGAYPNYTITSSTSTSAATSSLQVNTPHNVTTLGPNNYSLTVQPTSITGPGVIGAYPNYTLASSPSTSITAGSTNVIVSGTAPAYTIFALPPVITGTGVTTVTASANNFTVNTPPTKITYTPSTGIISYSPAVGVNTLNISPSVTFTNNVLTVGSNTVGVPVTGIWTRPSATVTTLTNVNDNVGIGISTPNNRLHVVESANGIAAINAVNTFTLSSNSAMGLYASSSNPNSISAAVYGTHSGGGNGVSGISSTTTFSSTAGVYGYAAGTLSTNVSVQADATAGNSTGLFANSFPGHNGLALYALKGGSAGNAAKIEINNTGNSADALFASTNGMGAAIHTKNANTAGANNLGVLVEDGHIGTLSSAIPLIGATACTACNSASLQAQSNDIAGTFAYNMTASYGANYSYTITFNKPYRKKPIITVSPASQVAASANYYIAIVGASGNYTGFTVTWPAGLNGGAGMAAFNYIVIESSN